MRGFIEHIWWCDARSMSCSVFGCSFLYSIDTPPPGDFSEWCSQRDLRSRRAAEGFGAGEDSARVGGGVVVDDGGGGGGGGVGVVVVVVVVVDVFIGRGGVFDVVVIFAAAPLLLLSLPLVSLLSLLLFQRLLKLKHEDARAQANGRDTRGHEIVALSFNIPRKTLSSYTSIPPPPLAPLPIRATT